MNDQAAAAARPGYPRRCDAALSLVRVVGEEEEEEKDHEHE